MEKQMKQIDVEKIMEEIRADIQKRGYMAENVDFENIAGNAKAILGIKTDFSAQQLENAINSAAGNHYIEYYRMIPKGGFKSFIQRSIRKMVKFMMIPMVDQQNQFNYQTVMSLKQTEAFIKDCNMQLEQKDKIIEELEIKISQLDRCCEILENRLKNKEG